MQEDSTGLYFKAEITETTQGKDVLALIRNQVLTKLSIGYKTEKSRFDTLKRVRVLQEVTLFEISVVCLPANDNANLTRFKSNRAITIDKLDSLIQGYLQKNKGLELHESIGNLLNLSNQRKK